MPHKVTLLENRIVAIIISQDEPTVKNGGPLIKQFIVSLFKGINLHTGAEVEHHVKTKAEIRGVPRSHETPDC